jgi:hypothetical protein
MYIYVEPHYAGLLFKVNDKTGALVEALAECTLATKEGYGESSQYIPKSNTPVELHVVQDHQVGARKETENLLLADKKATEERWLAEYRAHQETRVKLEKAEKTLAALGAAMPQTA